MFEECPVAFDEPEESIGAQRLHQPLNSAEAKDRAKIRRDRITGACALRFIIRQKLLAFRARECDVGIEEERGEIVLGEAGTHSLEIDEVRLAVANDDVLRLKVAVNENARPPGELFRDLA